MFTAHWRIMAIDIVHINRDSSEQFPEVAEDVFDEKIDPDRLTKYAQEENHILLVAIHENIIIGQVLAVIHLHPDKATELYIDDLGVSPKFQRQGIASSMLRTLFALGKRRGCEEIWAATEPDNKEAKGFYNSLNLSMRSALVFEGEL